MSETRVHARFPAISFISRAEFDNHLRMAQAELDALFLYERRLATAEASFRCPGTCGCCLRATTFTVNTEGGEALADGRMVPNWREQFSCDCADHLGARFRATLHFLQAVVGVSSWTRLLRFGPACPLDRRLLMLMPLTRALPRLTVEHKRYRLDAAAESQHLVLSLDVLHHVPPLDAALSEIRRVLVPGGQFVFTVPFHAFSNGTVSRLDQLRRRDFPLPVMARDPVHDLGWDLLDRLRAAGFRRAAAHCYRSEELGYLGPSNMIFAAEA